MAFVRTTLTHLEEQMEQDEQQRFHDSLAGGRKNTFFAPDPILEVNSDSEDDIEETFSEIRP